MDTVRHLQQNRYSTGDNGIIQDKFTSRTPSKIKSMPLRSFILARIVTQNLAANSSKGHVIIKLTLAREIINHGSEIEERELGEAKTSSMYHLLPAIASFIPLRNLSPTLQPPQTISPPPILQSADYQPHQNHNLGDSRLSQPQRPSTVRAYEPNIELCDISSRQREESLPEGEFEDTRTQRVGEGRPRRICSPLLCGVAIFLAPVNIVLGMIASHGDNWRLTFMGSFALWLLVGTIWLFLDLYGLQNSPFIKRCLWHIGGFIASIYFFMSIIHITSDNLPQWLPTVIDCGVGMSLGLQNIPASVRHYVGESITGIVTGIFGGTQVIIQRDEQRLSQTEEPLSSQVRRQDIETGSTA